MIRELDIYGRVRQEEGETNFVPFLFQGQYYDVETKLAYNRFRYYAPEWGMYISQDPIRLEAGLTNLYAYVDDTNGWIDPLGLDMIPNKVAGNAREKLAEFFIRRKYSKATILKERYIRDATGNSVFDSLSMLRRRLDIVVVENDRVTAIYEVTSPTANKTRQMEKESRIRTLAEGGGHIRTSGRKGKLYDISNVQTVRIDVDLDNDIISLHKYE